MKGFSSKPFGVADTEPISLKIRVANKSGDDLDPDPTIEIKWIRIRPLRKTRYAAKKYKKEYCKKFDYR